MELIQRLRGSLRDARIFQIAFLGTLLFIGVFVQDFSLKPAQIVLTFSAGLLTQWLCIRRLGLKQVGFLSALITCFGTCLLLRSDRLWVHPLAVSLAMSSKFWLRINGKHLFNPAMLGVVVSLLLLPGTWVSPGQWGFEIALTGWVFALGSCVVWRSKSNLISWPFLLSYASLLFYRVLAFGYRFEVLVHQLQNGAILLFTFFMISDPKTTPDHKAGRIIHAAAVALFAYYWQFKMYRQHGLIWGLFFLAPLVPILDYLFKARKFEWRSAKPTVAIPSAA